MNDHDVARCWDGNAEVWARQVRAGYDTYRNLYNNPAFFEFVGDLAGRVVLDAGCGEGYNTRLFARQGARMTGIDLSARMILQFARSAGGKILELGCGTGRVLIPIAAAGCPIMGLDLSEHMLAKCRQKLQVQPQE